MFNKCIFDTRILKNISTVGGGGGGPSTRMVASLTWPPVLKNLLLRMHCSKGKHLWEFVYNEAAFILILRRQNQRFETLIQNADPKRR